MNIENVIKFFFHMSTTIKTYHWQTTKYARHVASDSLHSTLLELIDQFVEVYIGRYRRPTYTGFRLNVQVLNDENIVGTLQRYIDFLKTDVPSILDANDTDLMNIRDEMLSALNKTLYLFTLE